MSSPTAGTAHDPIADVIGLLRPRTIGGCLHAAGAWAVRFEPYPHVKFGAVARGACWLTLEGRPPLLLREGDIFLLGNPPRHVLGSSPTVRPRSAKPLLAASPDGALHLGTEHAEEDTFVCGGSFAFDDPNAPLLLDFLPRLVHVPAGHPRGRVFEHVSQLLVFEMESAAAGGGLVIEHLAQVLLVHMLRAHADDPTARAAGWLGALGDARVGAALRAMHGDIAYRWTLDELARTASMSRSAFAASFKSQVGMAPLDYLIEWRMSVARDALRRNARSISELAYATGYESESAFSTAFRRVVGTSPKQFRDRCRGDQAHPATMV